MKLLNDAQYSKLLKSPFLLFSPFLVFFVALVLLFPTHGNKGDEGRYLIYSHLMTHGSLPSGQEDFNYLGDGPGYPILLIPFTALRLPLVSITVLNAFFYYFSIVLLFKIAIRFSSFFKAFIISLFWVCYFTMYEWIPLILPEVFGVFLVSLLFFLLIKAYEDQKPKKYIILSGLTFGYLILTKPIYGYVMLSMIFASAILWIIYRKSKNYRKLIAILLIALISNIPYLTYTYNITNKFFYWSSFGGNNLYWMSTPFNGEYGDWYSDPAPNSYPDKAKMLKGYGDLVTINHKKDFDEVKKYNLAEQQDDALKKIAINNIKSNPGKFIQNCIYNTSRIIFNYPYSYTFQNPATLYRLPLNGVILVLLLFCIVPTFVNWEKISFAVRFMLFFSLLYFGGSIFGSAETRMFFPVVPVLLVWIGLVFEKAIKINFGKWDQQNLQVSSEK